ncbi:RidA family protein [Cohnella sp. WQ 127256]|uniref:RidA family protein n=1 Tax=Cohnella sp. WQ 127256 TaxID=2938790 RepID=UPI0021179949|nr:RidA family protein [Cohnella sp. WQ 127256]
MNTKYGMDELPFSSATPSDSHLFVSGQGGTDPLTGEVTDDDLEGQTLLTIQNIENILAQSGLKLEDVVKVNVYLKSKSDYELFNRIYARVFPRPYPARTLVYCELNFNLLVEIDVIANLRK